MNPGRRTLRCCLRKRGCVYRYDPGFTVFEVGEEYEIDPADFLSMGKSTPFTGMKVFGKCLATVYNGKTVYCDKKII